MNLEICKMKSDYKSKENQYNLIEKLNEVCEILHDKIHINCGGCCYVAYCIAELLERFNIDFSLIIFDRDFNLNKVYDFYDIKRSMDHYAILLGDSIEDDIINGDELDYNNYYQSFKVTSEDILEHYNEGFWNNMYDVINNEFVHDTLESIFYEFMENLYKK